MLLSLSPSLSCDWLLLVQVGKESSEVDQREAAKTAQLEAVQNALRVAKQTIDDLERACEASRNDCASLRSKNDMVPMTLTLRPIAVLLIRVITDCSFKVCDCHCSRTSAASLRHQQFRPTLLGSWKQLTTCCLARWLVQRWQRPMSLRYNPSVSRPLLRNATRGSTL